MTGNLYQPLGCDQQGRFPCAAAPGQPECGAICTIAVMAAVAALVVAIAWSIVL